MKSGNARLEDLKDRYVFWDVDGTLAPYRFNGHVADPGGSNNGMSLQEISDGVFLYREPSRHMQEVVTTCEAKKQIVMGHCQNDKEMQDKIIWLKQHFPVIEDYLLVSEAKSKADTILEYCMFNNINVQNVVFVDDIIPFLREAEHKGIKSFHISSFLDWPERKCNEKYNDYCW